MVKCIQQAKEFTHNVMSSARLKDSFKKTILFHTLKFKKLAMVSGICNLTLRRLRQEDHYKSEDSVGLHTELKANYGYTVRPCIKRWVVGKRAPVVKHEYLDLDLNIHVKELDVSDVHLYPQH